MFVYLVSCFNMINSKLNNMCVLIGLGCVCFNIFQQSLMYDLMYSVKVKVKVASLARSKPQGKLLSDN